ncbi:MAG TPA: hypothetical protein PLO89_07035 [Spirochaetota bacterium]|nr:hypothetical protein [Spirochaetota bacterium]
MKYFFILVTFAFFLAGCKTTDKSEQNKIWDFEKYMVEAKRLANGGKYQQAISLLKETLVKFPDEDVLSINYNIGFNLYKLKKYDDAKSYFNIVIKMFEEKEFSEAERLENKKFVVLSTLVIDKIKNDIDEQKDPYHIQDDINKNKVLKPKK